MFEVGDKVRFREFIGMDAGYIQRALESVGMPLDTVFTVRMVDIGIMINLSMELGPEFKAAELWNEVSSNDAHWWVKLAGLEPASRIYVGGE